MRFSPLTLFTVIFSTSSRHVYAKTKSVPLTAEFIEVTTNPAHEVPNRIKFNDDGTMDLIFINGSAIYPSKWTKLLGITDLNSGEWSFQIDYKITSGNINSDSRVGFYMYFNIATGSWPGSYGQDAPNSGEIGLYHGNSNFRPHFTLTKCGQTTGYCNLRDQGDPFLAARDNGGIVSYRLQRLVTGHVKFTMLTGGSGATEGDTVWIEGTSNEPMTFVALSDASNMAPVSIYCQYINVKVTHIRISDEGTVGAGGDPHFVGFGGIHYSWQGVCDLILLKTPKTSSTSPEVSIHIRTSRVRKWSAIHDVAMKVGNDVVEIGSTNGKPILNGKEVESIEHETFSVLRLNPKSKRIVVYDVDFRNSKKLELRVNTRSQMINMKVNGIYPKDTVGLLGSPHNPGLISRNGTIMDEKEINKFTESWQVNDRDPDLFQNSREPKFPSQCQYFESQTKSTVRERRLKEIHELKLSDARAACAAHQSGYMRDFCVDDVLATGDIDIAEDSFYG